MIKALFVLLFFLSISELRSEVYYLKPRAYLDVLSGKMIYQKVIGIEDGIIRSIESKAPKGKAVQRLDHLYLLPGLIDCHTHVFFTQTIEDKNFEDALLREVGNSEEFRTSRAKVFLKQYLNEGFTSVCDLGNSGNFLDVRLKSEIISDYNYPDFFVSGQGLASAEGQFYPKTSADLVKKEYSVINQNTDLEALLQEYLKRNIDILKIYADNSPGTGGLSSDLIQKIANSPKIKKFKKITFHAIDNKSVDSLLKMPGIGIEHGTNGIWRNKKIADAVYLTLTDLPQDILKKFNYYNKASYLFQISRAKEAYKKKIQLVFGPDFYFHSHEANFNRASYVKKSIEVWSESGISPIDIVRAMTINAASSLGKQNNLGIVKVGARANLIGVSSNPLNDLDSLNKIELLISKGKILKSPSERRLQRKE